MRRVDSPLRLLSPESSAVFELQTVVNVTDSLKQIALKQYGLPLSEARTIGKI
jgi:hypothetical protein